MSVTGGNHMILTKALKDLTVFWEESERWWRDEARTGFEKDYIAELANAVRLASIASQQIEDLLNQARRQCS